MKNKLATTYQKTSLFLLGLLISTMSIAQEGLDIDVDLDGSDDPSLISRPLFWIAIAVLLIILAIIAKGRNK